MENVEMEQTVYTIDVKLMTRWYPKKHQTDIEAGEWQICRVKVVNHAEPVDDEFETEYGQITIVGNMLALSPFDDSVYRVNVVKTFNEKFNKVQYNVLYSRELREFKTDKQRRDFLGMFITPKQIDALYEITDNPIELLDKGDIEGLTKATGIGTVTAEKMIVKYEGCKDYGVAYGELGAMGLTPAMIKKLIDRYQSADAALDKVRKDPYILADEVDGIGFKRADEIALSNGIHKHSSKRVRAFILYYMNDIADNTGSTFMTYDELLDAIDDELGRDTPQETIDECMQSLINKNVIWYMDRETEDSEGPYIETVIALSKNYSTEVQIAQHLSRLLSGENNVNLTEEEINERIKAQELKQGWEYTKMQKYGVKVVADNNVSIIRGYGGTGKSSTVAGLLSCLEDDYWFTQCALSGKASVNLRDITGQDGYTIHTLLGYNPQNGFTVNESNPLGVKLVILDEASMVDARLFLHLLKAIPTGTKLVMLGDTNQLEAIGIGNLLMDMIDSGIIPTVTFDEIHRQGQKSGIIPFSKMVAEGICKYKDSWEGIDILGELQDLKIHGFKCERDEEKPSIQLIMNEFKDMYKECKDISQIAVVLPTKSRGTSCYKVNKLIQDVVLPRRSRGAFIELGTKTEPFKVHRGDKIINLKNNYNVQPNIFNGNMGEIISLDVENKSIVVDFYNIGEVELKGKDLDNIDLGYAITVHKAQGSTIPYMVGCLDSTHYVMLKRQLFYTLISRAKKRGTLIVETKAMNRAIRTNDVIQKRTFLYFFLTGELPLEKSVDLEAVLVHDGFSK